MQAAGMHHKALLSWEALRLHGDFHTEAESLSSRMLFRTVATKQILPFYCVPRGCRYVTDT